jgi:hypothetical protein
MRWSRDDLTDYLLDRMNLQNRDEQEKSNMFDRATIFALKNDKLHALVSLLERGTGLSPLDVGTRHCYLQAYCERPSSETTPQDDTSSSEMIPSFKVAMAAAKFKRLRVHKYLKWKVLDSKPSTGTEIENENLKKALLQRISTDKAIIELKEDDFAKGGIDVQNLSPESYVALPLICPADGVVHPHMRYFKPDIGLEDNVDNTTENSAAVQYLNAAKNWTALIAHANQTNPQFHELWQEHQERYKIHCNRSPLMQSLLEGDISGAVFVLVRQLSLLFCCRATDFDSPTNGRTEELLVAENQMYSSTLNDLYQQLGRPVDGLHEEAGQHCCCLPHNAAPKKDTNFTNLAAGRPVSRHFRMKLYRYFKMTTPTLGLKWKNMGDTRPDGRDLGDSELAHALTRKLQTRERGGGQEDCTDIKFTHREWEAFGIKNLHIDDFVKAGDSYFSPSNLQMMETLKSKKNKFKLYRQLILLETL